MEFGAGPRLYQYNEGLYGRLFAWLMHVLVVGFNRKGSWYILALCVVLDIWDLMNWEVFDSLKLFFSWFLGRGLHVIEYCACKDKVPFLYFSFFFFGGLLNSLVSWLWFLDTWSVLEWRTCIFEFDSWFGRSSNVYPLKTSDLFL